MRWSPGGQATAKYLERPARRNNGRCFCLPADGPVRVAVGSSKSTTSPSASILRHLLAQFHHRPLPRANGAQSMLAHYNFIGWPTKSLSDGAVKIALVSGYPVTMPTTKRVRQHVTVPSTRPPRIRSRRCDCHRDRARLRTCGGRGSMSRFEMCETGGRPVAENLPESSGLPSGWPDFLGKKFRGILFRFRLYRTPIYLLSSQHPSRSEGVTTGGRWPEGSSLTGKINSAGQSET
jgi:hypothetical protein